MRRAFLVSVAIHIVVLTFLLGLVLLERAVEPLEQELTIRFSLPPPEDVPLPSSLPKKITTSPLLPRAKVNIEETSETSISSSQKASPELASPSPGEAVKKDFIPEPELPVSPLPDPPPLATLREIPDKKPAPDQVDIKPAKELVSPNRLLSPVRTLLQELSNLSPPPPPSIAELIPKESLDPLFGLEDSLALEDNPSPHSEDSWDVSWFDGHHRSLVSFRAIDFDAIPQDNERLVNLSIFITVSPQGDVLSAVVKPPGSGDIRIDRYMHGLALSIVFEPLSPDSSAQEATLRLRFQDQGES